MLCFLMSKLMFSMRFLFTWITVDPEGNTFWTGWWLAFTYISWSICVVSFMICSFVLFWAWQAIQQLQSKSNQSASTQQMTQNPPMDIMLVGAAMDIFQSLIKNLDTEGRYLFLNAVANQLRYPNNHTHYFSFVLLFLFGEKNQVRLWYFKQFFNPTFFCHVEVDFSIPNFFSDSWSLSHYAQLLAMRDLKIMFWSFKIYLVGTYSGANYKGPVGAFDSQPSSSLGPSYYFHWTYQGILQDLYVTPIYSLWDATCFLYQHSPYFLSIIFVQHNSYYKYAESKV